MMRKLTGIQIGPAPVGVAAEQVGRRFARLVVQPILLAVELQHQRMIQVITRDGPHAVGREKLVFVQHVRQHAPQLIGAHQAQDQRVVGAGRHHRPDALDQIRAGAR